MRRAGNLARGSTPALPWVTGAEGVGAAARGGRWGQDYVVTTLADSGAGSLRYGVETMTGRRTIRFDVAGDIALESDVQLTDDECVTIDGSTAPAGGVCIRDATLRLIRARDVVLRHLRLRPGPDVPDTDVGDGLELDGCEDVLLKNLSVSWSTDECVTIARSNRVSLQNCLIAEPLNSIKTHHGYALMLKGQSGQISVIGNAITTFWIRGLCMSQLYGAPGYDILAANNCWHAGYAGYVHGYDDDPPLGPDQPCNIVLLCNRIRIGPKWSNAATQLTPWLAQAAANWWLLGNVLADKNDAVNLTTAGVCADNWAGMHFYEGVLDPIPTTTAAKQAAVGLAAVPDWRGPAYTLLTADAAWAEYVTAGNVGATLPRQDDADLRMLANMRNGTYSGTSDTGLVELSPDEVGGYPVLSP
jgi:hypothetical protein